MQYNGELLLHYSTVRCSSHLPSALYQDQGFCEIWWLKKTILAYLGNSKFRLDYLGQIDINLVNNSGFIGVDSVCACSLYA